MTRQSLIALLASSALAAAAFAASPAPESIAGLMQLMSTLRSTSCAGGSVKMVPNDYTLQITGLPASGPCTINLPVTNVGMQYRIVDSSGGAAKHNLILTPPPSVTVDGNQNYTLSTPYGIWAGILTDVATYTTIAQGGNSSGGGGTVSNGPATYFPLIGLSNSSVVASTSPVSVTLATCYNPNANVSYLQLFDSLTPTVGTTFPALSVGIPPGLSSGFSLPNGGVNFLVGVSAAATTTAHGNVAANMDCNIAILSKPTNASTYMSMLGIGNTSRPVKNAPGALTLVVCYNPNPSVVYAQLFDATAPTVGSTAPALSVGIPPGLSDGFANADGVTFNVAISLAVTTTANGSGAPATPADCGLAFK